MTLSNLCNLAVLTTGRQDYGILRSTILALGKDPRFRLQLWVGGMQLSPRYGRAVELIRQDGAEIACELDFLSEPPSATADAARALDAIGRQLGTAQPDALLLVGDRMETLAAGMAATIATVPVVHLHGGEETEGAIDNACRHALTKLSCLHLVSHPRHAERVLQMGEHPDRIVVVGAPGLDNLYREDLPSLKEVAESLGRTLLDPLVLVTVHPTTLGDDPIVEVKAVADAMDRVAASYLVTAPNADAGGMEVRRFWEGWVENRENVVLVDALGETRYWSVLRSAAAVVGNSSSGIIEAPAAGVPVINVGDRQRGRFRYGAVADVPSVAGPISAALTSALKEGICAAGVRAPGNGYPVGPAAPRIVEALAHWEIPSPPRKAFRGLRCHSDG